MSTQQHQHGIELFNQGRYPEALQIFSEILQRADDSEVWNDWGTTQVALGRAEEARTAFEKALSLDPCNTIAAENLRTLDAQSTAETASAEPDAASSLHRKAVQLFRKGELGDAAEALAQALCVEETSVRWNDFATIQLAAGEIAKAEKAYRRALQLNPGDQLAAANLVVLLESLNRDADIPAAVGEAPATMVAQQRFEVLRSFACKPNAQLFRNLLSRHICSFPEQDPELSEAHTHALRKARDSGSFARRCYELLASCAADSITNLFLAMEELAGVDHRLWAALGLWHMKQGEYAAASSLFRKVFDENPADLSVERWLIECEHQWHAVDSAHPDPFAGVERYLAESFCTYPWERLEIGGNGDLSLCCPGWQPCTIGNANGSSAEEMWNAPLAQEIRNSIRDGSFRYCSWVHCPHISGRSLPRRDSDAAHLRAFSGQSPTPRGPSMLMLSYDRSCNLACRQCRSGFFSADAAQQEQMDRDYQQFVLDAARDASTLYLNGAGEVFGSRHSRNILRLMTRRRFPHLQFYLISNAQLFDRRVFEEFDLGGRLTRLDISLDAATAETYRRVRHGGDFARALSSLEFLDSLRIHEGEKFVLTLKFVASAENFREIPDFVRLGRRFHADSVFFTIIRNWGHLSPAEFDQLNIASPGHPLHSDFIHVLDSPELADPIVEWGSIRPFRTPAVKAVSSSPQIVAVEGRGTK
jgi:Flp pilus assembly protein TadD